MQRETDFVRKACVHEPPDQRLHEQGGRNPHFSSMEAVFFGSLGFFLILESGPIITTSWVPQQAHRKMGISPPLWKCCHHLHRAYCQVRPRELHTLKTACLTLFFFNAFCLCPLVLSGVIHRRNNPQGKIGEFKDLYWTMGFIFVQTFCHFGDFLLEFLPFILASVGMSQIMSWFHDVCPNQLLGCKRPPLLSIGNLACSIQPKSQVKDW